MRFALEARHQRIITRKRNAKGATDRFVVKESLCVGSFEFFKESILHLCAEDTEGFRDRLSGGGLMWLASCKRGGERRCACGTLRGLTGRRRHARRGKLASGGRGAWRHSGSGQV